MSKHQLALELRQRQYAKGMVPKHMIDALSDEDIIDSYVTCSGCGKKQVTDVQKETAIWQATNAEEFFALCDRFEGAGHHHH
jgi:hypothetical protein